MIEWWIESTAHDKEKVERLRFFSFRNEKYESYMRGQRATFIERKHEREKEKKIHSLSLSHIHLVLNSERLTDGANLIFSLGY